MQRGFIGSELQGARLGCTTAQTSTTRQLLSCPAPVSVDDIAGRNHRILLPPPSVALAEQPAATQEPQSVIQRLVDNEARRGRRRADRVPRTPQPAVHPDSSSTGIQGELLQHVLLTPEMRAGEGAAAIASRLRESRRAIFHFSTVLGTNKALRVLALSNQFLNQHLHAVSFSFLSPHGPGGQKRFGEDWSAEGVQLDGQQQRDPQPERSLLSFDLVVWSRDLDEPELDLRPANAIRLLEFAVNIRKQWTQAHHVTFDAAYAMADNLYDQLMAHHARAMAVNAGQEGPEGASSLLSDAPQPSASMVASVDGSQAVLLVLAMRFLQERLHRESSPAALAATAYRSSHSMPRLDGRNGYVLKLQLVPQAHITGLLNTHPPRQLQQPPKQVPPLPQQPQQQHQHHDQPRQPQQRRQRQQQQEQEQQQEQAHERQPGRWRASYRTRAGQTGRAAATHK